MNKKISNRITILGFIMSCIIAMYHCGNGSISCINLKDERMNYIVIQVSELVAKLAMSYFFTVTGFLLFINLNLKKWLVKLKSRFLSLLIPYLIWNVVYACIFSAWGFWGTFKETVFMFEMWPPAAQLWYLYAVFFLVILSPIFLLLFKRKKIGAIVLFVLIIGVFRCSISDNGIVQSIVGHGYIGNVVYYLPAYLLGSYMGMQKGKESNSSDDGYKSELGLCLGLVILSLIIDCAWNSFSFNIIINVIPTCLLFLFPVFEGEGKKYTILKRLCNLSFLIYALHLLVIYKLEPYIRMIIFKILPYVSITNIITRAVMLVIIIGICELLYELLIRICPIVLNILTGGRVKDLRK